MNRSVGKGNIPTKKISTSVQKAGITGGRVQSLGMGRKKGRTRPKGRRMSITGTLNEATERNLRKPKNRRIPSWLVDKAKKSIKTHF